MLLDASGLIALARIGRLQILPTVVGRVHVTRAVLAEATEPDEPGAGAILDLVDEGSITLIETADKDEGEEAVQALTELGLGPGEASLIAACTEQDTLVLDDGNARRAARARGLRLTGLLGLLVAAVERGRLPRDEGIDTLRALARSDFRMTVELYDWARERMER